MRLGARQGLAAALGGGLGITLLALVAVYPSMAGEPEPGSKKACAAESVILKTHNAKTNDRARSEIRRIGRWRIVSSEADKPDLVVQFDSGDTYTRIVKGGVRLLILDAKTGEELWRDHQKTLFWRDTTTSLMRRLEERCPQWKEAQGEVKRD